MAKSFTDYVQTVIVKKGLTGLFQCPATEAGVISYNEKTYYANGVTANINLNYTGTIPDGYKAIFTYNNDYLTPNEDGTYSITIDKSDVFIYSYLEVSNDICENSLSIEDTEVCKGGSIALPVNLNNTESITALQFEMALPAGVTISKCQLTDRKGDDHTASSKKLANGNYQLAAFSGSKTPFSGTEGAVLNLTLDVNKDMTEGEYPISLTNIELTTVATKAINPVGVSATLTVSDVKIGMWTEAEESPSRMQWPL